VSTGASGGPPCDLEEPPGNNNVTSQADPIAIGQVLCGGFSVAEDADTFSFEAVQGVTYLFETWAARLGSPSDTFLSVRTSSGAPLVDNDDFGGTFDSQLLWQANSSGTRYVQVTELNARFGDDYTYRLVTAVQP
jgi:hypothetical protein